MGSQQKPETVHLEVPWHRYIHASRLMLLHGARHSCYTIHSSHSFPVLSLKDQKGSAPLEDPGVLLGISLPQFILQSRPHSLPQRVTKATEQNPVFLLGLQNTSLTTVIICKYLCQPQAFLVKHYFLYSSKCKSCFLAVETLSAKLSGNPCHSP